MTKAFGGKVVDLKESGLDKMTIGSMMNGKKRIAPTEVVGAFWVALREAEVEDGIKYFGVPSEIGDELTKEELKERKAKLKK